MSSSNSTPNRFVVREAVARELRSSEEEPPHRDSAMLAEEAVGQRVAGFSFCQGRSEFVRYVHKMCGPGAVPKVS